MPSRRVLAAALVTGLLIRLLALPLPGTGDVVIWKVWSFAGSHDLTSMYGIGGSPPERRALHWRGEAMTVDYPPVALAELSLAGRLYRLWDPAFDDSRMLNVAVKLPGLAAEVTFLLWVLWRGRAIVGDTAAWWMAIAIWLNPALLLDNSVLGYLDMQMAVPLTMAVIAAWRGRSVAAGCLLMLAVLTKAQAIFVAPVVVIAALRQSISRTTALAEMTAAGAVTAAVAFVPFIARGAWSNLTQALSRLAAHDMLSAQAANVWWIFTWMLRVLDVGPEWGWQRSLTQEVRILAITRAVDLGYPNARVVGLVVFAALAAWGLVALWRRPSLVRVTATAAWTMYAYAMFAAQVHENHLAPAVVLLAPAAALEPRLRWIFWALTGVVTFNLYLFYGFGEGWPALFSRQITYVDASVLLAVASLGTFAWFTRALARVPR
ncbi:MAG: hypothetical protein ABI634_00955 [Acidobacteriota bacterium]